ncbi:hypothetical protein HN028_06360 [Pantoea ananatis]|uniref:hypothetical protein n=1 Tax=Pantoea ananas TaxID=553 RepID=UPI00352A0905
MKESTQPGCLIKTQHIQENYSDRFRQNKNLALIKITMTIITQLKYSHQAKTFSKKHTNEENVGIFFAFTSPH